MNVSKVLTINKKERVHTQGVIVYYLYLNGISNKTSVYDSNRLLWKHHSVVSP